MLLSHVTKRDTVEINKLLEIIMLADNPLYVLLIILHSPLVNAMLISVNCES